MTLLFSAASNAEVPDDFWAIYLFKRDSSIDYIQSPADYAKNQLELFANGFYAYYSGCSLRLKTVYFAFSMRCT
jgi:hypothetical protein